MRIKNLKYFNLAQGPEYKAIKYSKSGCGSGGGKPIYNREKLAKKSKPILGRSLTPDEVSRFLYATGKRIELGLKSGRYKKAPDGTIYEDPDKTDIEKAFGNVEGKGGFNSLAKEVWRLALVGKGLKNRSTLCKKYHLPVGCLKEQWDEGQEYFEKLPAQEIEALRNLECLKPLTRKERQFWRELQAEQRKQKGQKPIIKNRFAKPGRETSPEEYKEKFGHSLDSDGKEFEKSGYKRIRPGAKVFISSCPSLASSVPRTAKEKTAEARPH
jgi:hypothetical protein